MGFLETRECPCLFKNIRIIETKIGTLCETEGLKQMSSNQNFNLNGELKLNIEYTVTQKLVVKKRVSLNFQQRNSPYF